MTILLIIISIIVIALIRSGISNKNKKERLKRNKHSYSGDFSPEFTTKKEVKDKTFSEKPGDDIAKMFMAQSPELYTVVKSGDKEKFCEFSNSNPDLMDSMITELAYMDEPPAERLRLKAIDKMHKEDDFVGAIQLINKGLKIYEPETEEFLYELRAECNIELKNYYEALKDLNRAIELRRKMFPDTYHHLSYLLKKRVKLKTEMRDLVGADEDKKKAVEYYEKGRDNR